MTPKLRAERNRTLIITQEEQTLLSKRLFRPIRDVKISNAEIVDKTICADLFEILDLLPKEFADLIVIDPPYNLSKDFHGFKFNATDNENYLTYLRSWFGKVISFLKPNGSLYLCGDWKCTSALQTVMEEHLTVLNRITWQREKGRGA